MACLSQGHITGLRLLEAVYAFLCGVGLHVVEDHVSCFFHSGRHWGVGVGSSNLSVVLPPLGHDSLELLLDGHFSLGKSQVTDSVLWAEVNDLIL